MKDKIPPHSSSAEKGVLGCILLDNNMYYKAGETITPDDMYEQRNALIYRIMGHLAARGEAIDIVTTVEELRRKGELDRAGGAAYISGLTEATGSPRMLESYTKIVKDKSILRSVISRGYEMTEAAYSEPQNVEDFLSSEISKTFDLSVKTSQSAKHIKGIVGSAATYISEINSKNRPQGFKSGYRALDQKLGGFRDAEFIVIAARPSVGKTAIATQLMLNSELPSAMFSVEMGANMIAARMMAQRGGLNLFSFLSGNMVGNKQAFADLLEAGNKVSGKDIWIDDNPKITISSLTNKAHRLVHEQKIKSVWVDYLQIVSSPQEREKNGSREAEVSAVSRQLKAMAKELNIPVVALAQLKRGGDAREDKRPMLSDLNWSGQIEQDADVVIALHRPDYYERHKRKESAAVGEVYEKVVDMELIILKHRNGPNGIVKLRYDTESLTFHSIEDGY